jgi:hypothetical protein
MDWLITGCCDLRNELEDYISEHFAVIFVLKPSVLKYP